MTLKNIARRSFPSYAAKPHKPEVKIDEHGVTRTLSDESGDWEINVPEGRNATEYLTWVSSLESTTETLVRSF